jgi:hypothetical protein
MNQRGKPVSLGRHKRNCSVCSHAQRREIEAAFVAQSPGALAAEYGLADWASIWHAHALSLFANASGTSEPP